MSRHYFSMSQHKIKKGINPRLVFVATFNDGTTNSEPINRSCFKPERSLASSASQST